MDCDRWKSKIELYLDGELPEDDMRALDAHLRACPSCAAEVLGHVQLKRAVHAAALEFTPDPVLRNRVQALFASKAQPPWTRVWRLPAVAVAVACVALLAGSYLLRQHTRTERVYAEIADLHVTTLASASPVDVVSSDRHTVKPWFAGKIPFTFNLPELQNTQFSLIGGRVTYLEQAPGAELIYQIRQHRISVFIFPERFASRSLPEAASVKQFESFGLQTWTKGGLRYFVIGDASAADIQNLADLLKKA